MKNPLWLIGSAGILVAGACVGGCGGPSSPPGYLTEVHTGGQLSAVAFVQITVSGSQMTGTWEETYLEPGDTQAYPFRLSLSGTESGQSVTLTLSGTVSGPGGSVPGTGTVSGTLDGGTLTLEVPQADGTLASMVFTSSSSAAYNQAVGTLQARAAAASASEQASAHAATEQSAAASEEASAAAQQAGLDAAVTAAAKQVLSDMEGLQGLSIDTSALANDLQAQQNDLATMRSEEAAAAAAPASEQCGDADTVQGDADTVQGDADTVQGDADTVSGDVSGPQTWVASLQSDFAKLQAAEQADPGFAGGAYMGVDVANVTPPAPVASGAEIMSLVAGSPAAAAGLASGDVIVSFDGAAITSTTDLTTALAAVRGGEAVSLGWVDASGGRHTGTITLGTFSLPSKAQVDAAVASAQSTISGATSTASKDVTTAQSVATAAATEASNFVNQYCG